MGSSRPALLYNAPFPVDAGYDPRALSRAFADNAGTLRGGRFRVLAIIPVSYHRLLMRQPVPKRPFLRLGSAMGGGAIYLSSIVLSQLPAELAQRIYDFVKEPAPR